MITSSEIHLQRQNLELKEGAEETAGVYSAHRTSAVTFRTGGLEALAVSQNSTIFIDWYESFSLSVACTFSTRHTTYVPTNLLLTFS